MKSLAQIGFDNTGKILAQRKELDDFMSFIDLIPCKRDVSFKPRPVAGSMAYSYDGYRPAVCKLVDGPSCVINGRWHRTQDWSSEPWTKEDVAAYSKALLDESRRVEAISKKVMSAYRERTKLRKQFTGK